MDTKVKIRLSVKEMEFLFDNPQLVNIRHYISNDYVNDRSQYTITVRHNEDEKPRELIKKGLKVLKLKNKLKELNEKLDVANERENQVLANRGWGHAMRCTKIGFSTTRTDSLKARIEVVKEELDNLTK